MQLAHRTLQEEEKSAPVRVLSIGDLREIDGSGSFDRDSSITKGWFFDFYIDDSITSPLYTVKLTEPSTT